MRYVYVERLPDREMGVWRTRHRHIATLVDSMVNVPRVWPRFKLQSTIADTVCHNQIFKILRRVH